MSETTELKLQRLVASVDQFVNGAASDRVAIEGGRTIGTLASIDQKAHQIKYVQKLAEYSKLADAQLDAAGDVIIGPGNVVRVFGETDVALNRVYEVQADKTLLPIDYTDIYDLKNAYPAPYNFKTVRQSLADLNDQTKNKLLSYTVQWSDTKAYNIFLKGHYKIVSHKAGLEGVVMGDFTLLVSLKDTDVQFVFSPANTTKLARDGNALIQDGIYPTLKAVIADSTPGRNVLHIKPVWTQTVLQDGDPIMLEWHFDNLDKTPYY